MNAPAKIARVTPMTSSTWAPVRDECVGEVGGCTSIRDAAELGVTEAVVGVDVRAAVVGVVVVELPEPTTMLPPRPVTGSVRPGVGSKRYQPTFCPSHTSGHAWASSSLTCHSPSAPAVPR